MTSINPRAHSIQETSTLAPSLSADHKCHQMYWGGSAVPTLRFNWVTIRWTSQSCSSFSMSFTFISSSCRWFRSDSCFFSSSSIARGLSGSSSVHLDVTGLRGGTYLQHITNIRMIWISSENDYIEKFSLLQGPMQTVCSSNATEHTSVLNQFLMQPFSYWHNSHP